MAIEDPVIEVGHDTGYLVYMSKDTAAAAFIAIARIASALISAGLIETQTAEALVAALNDAMQPADDPIDAGADGDDNGGSN